MGERYSQLIFNDFPELLDRDSLVDVLVKTASKHGRTIKTLVYSFVSREKILEINATHLGHHYETDIITFDYSRGKKLAGDVYICESIVIENAKRFNTAREMELYRVIFHGLLHLLGFNDSNAEEVEEMRAKENECLAQLIKT